MLASVLAKPTQWNQFRGPNGDGDANDADLPVSFSEKDNLVWSVPFEGKAWSSPVVSDGLIWATNAKEEGKRLWAYQFDWKTGHELQKILVF